MPESSRDSDPRLSLVAESLMAQAQITRFDDRTHRVLATISYYNDYFEYMGVGLLDPLDLQILKEDVQMVDEYINDYIQHLNADIWRKILFFDRLLVRQNQPFKILH